jgi:recombination protein RecR
MERHFLGSPRLEHLVKLFSRFPGIGRKSATRMALHVLARPQEEAMELAESLREVTRRVRSCEQCGAISEEASCELCRDPQRQAALLCVVEQPTDIFSLEKAAVFRGRYHVLGGLLSPLDGVEASDLRLASLRRRVEEEGVKEVVLALPGSVEGEATALYVARLLAESGATTSRLATGIPVGGQLEYVDEVTLERAFSGRRPLD